MTIRKTKNAYFADACASCAEKNPPELLGGEFMGDTAGVLITGRIVTLPS
jgi:hypothetical protein